MDELSCLDLSKPIGQLAVLLYPPELLNEKFLIRIRDCVIKLNEDHPVKRWLKWISTPRRLNKKEEETRVFIQEILSSQFNLITDTKAKTKIIETLSEVKGDSLPEKILRSYLYLLIGNITRSDNILKDVLNTPPAKLWVDTVQIPQSYFDVLTRDNLAQILQRLSRHPSDRKVEQLFIRYLAFFTNDPSLREELANIDTSAVDDSLSLKYTERIAPAFVHVLRLSKVDPALRNERMLKRPWYTTENKSYWIWPFLELNPVITKEGALELKKFEETDHLWFIYLMQDQNLADAFQMKNKQSFLPGRRQYLRSLLNDDKTFMLALFKVIEFGDIDEEIVSHTVKHLIHE